MSHNPNLLSLPAELGTVTTLNSKLFVSIPPGISQLQDLRLLNVSHNPNLLSLPAELGTVTTLNSKFSGLSLLR